MMKLFFCIFALPIFIGGRAFGIALPHAESIPIQSVFTAKTIAEVEQIEENRAKYVELSQTCRIELDDSQIPTFCYEAVAIARALKLEVSLETEAELDELCKTQSSKTFDLSLLDRAKSREHISRRCLQYIREQQNIVLYKAEDL